MSRLAKEFLATLPQQAVDKIDYNIKKIQRGFMDAEIFKKLHAQTSWFRCAIPCCAEVKPEQALCDAAHRLILKPFLLSKRKGFTKRNDR